MECTRRIQKSFTTKYLTKISLSIQSSLIKKWLLEDNKRGRREAQEEIKRRFPYRYLQRLLRDHCLRYSKK